jgi:hypothetical protein
MQFGALPKPAVGILFDSDMGNDIDDALALALLYGLDGKNEVRVVSLTVSRSNVSSAAFCDAVARFYAGPVSGAFGAFARTLPVGMATDARLSAETPMLTVPLSKKKADGAPVYPSGIETMIETADPATVIRNALTAQHDQNAIVVLTGPATNLVRAMALPGVRDLIAHKVRFLSVSGGSFPDGEAELNIKSDIASAKKLFTEWPTPIVAAGKEIGDAIPFPGSSIDKDFAWTADHPVADAYRAFQPMPYDAASSDMAAVLYAGRPKEGYFKVSGPGTITVQEDGRTKFAESASGKHKYLMLDLDQKDRVIKAYTEIASAKPVPKVRRRFPGADQKKDQKPEQKQEAKPPVPAK